MVSAAVRARRGDLCSVTCANSPLPGEALKWLVLIVETMASTSPANTPGRGPAGIHRWYYRLGISSALLLAIAAAGALLITVLVISRSITIPLVLAVAVALVTTPMVDWLERRGVGRSLGSLIAIVLFVGAFVGAGLLIGFALVDQSDELRLQLDEAQSQIEEFLEGSPIDPGIVGEVRDGVESTGPIVRDGALTAVATLLDSAWGLISGVIIGLVFLYYLLKDGAMLARKALGLYREADRPAVEEAGAYAGKAVRDYFGSRTVVSLLNAVVITVAMLIIGVPEAGSIGVVNFIGGYIPYLGAFIGGAFAVLLGISEGGIGLGLVALAIVLFVQLALENLVEPRLVGEFVDMHPLVVLIVTILGGMFGGIVGLILAVPIASVIFESVQILNRRGYFDDDSEM